MNEEERKSKLHELTGYLLTKYDLKHHSINHICFNIKAEDVIYIVNKYKDILESSNLFISRYSAIENFTFNNDNFKISTCQTWLYIEDNDYKGTDNFQTYIELEKVTEIEIDISCETILSFHFSHPSLEIAEHYSFRNDKR
jgi:hypothetical protein